MTRSLYTIRATFTEEVPANSEAEAIERFTDAHSIDFDEVTVTHEVPMADVKADMEEG